VLPLLIDYPEFNPVAIALGPITIRWYALAYITGIVLGWQLMKVIARRPPRLMSDEQCDDFVVWCTLGIVLGGRIGHVLFYQPLFYLEHPLEIVMVWRGGMSFHGGLIGVFVAIWWTGRRAGVGFLRLGDVVAPVVPIGLFFGRIANFINGELWGRITDVPWAMIFPTGGPIPRHPSQLYEAVCEGIVLFTIMMLLVFRTRLRDRPGFIGGAFLVLYGIARSSMEFFREPDANLGFLWDFITMGQLLSLPMIAVGAWLMWTAKPMERPPAPAASGGA
jgi:phosphatidylglycerol:prolipoprotein diacylglycerol transferase